MSSGTQSDSLLSMSGTQVGRKSIFRGKVHRYHGGVSEIGKAKFEAARRTLASMAGREVAAVSDGDVMEFLARGIDDTRKYLARQS